MRGDFRAKRRTLLTLVVLLVAADVALGAYAWKLGTARSAQQELAVLMRNRDLLKKDIQRAQEIRRRIPDIQKDCNQYEESALIPVGTESSTITSELTSLATSSGLRLDSRSFKSSEIKGNSRLTQLAIDAQVTGDYRGVVRFLNGLQRSSHFYAVEGLSARREAKSTGSRDTLRVSIHIKTYVRAA